MPSIFLACKHRGNYFFGIENDRRVSFFAEKKEVLQDFSAIKIPA